jgi:hypothetical protein
MKNWRTTLWLLLFSQLMFLMGSLLDPPTSWLMILLRLIMPILGIIFIGLMLAGYIGSRKE